MNSLKSYLLHEDDKNPYRRAMDIVMQGIALHTVPGKETSYDRFREALDRLAPILTGDTEPNHLLAAARELSHVLENHTRSTIDFIHRQNSEHQKIVSMLIETVIKIGSKSEASAAKLRGIERALAHAREPEGIRDLKIQLAACLETTRHEADGQRIDGTTASVAQQKVSPELSKSAGPIARPKKIDSVTGMPGKQEAEKALRSVVASPDGKYVIVAVVNRVNAVNARFGYAAGDQMLARCAKHFRAGLSASDELYRWQGPAFLAILSRNGRIDEVRAEFRRFAGEQLHQTVELGSRSVMIPISSNWSVLSPSSSLEALYNKIEAFTSAQVTREYA